MSNAKTLPRCSQFFSVSLMQMLQGDGGKGSGLGYRLRVCVVDHADDDRGAVGQHMQLEGALSLQKIGRLSQAIDVGEAGFGHTGRNIEGGRLLLVGDFGGCIGVMDAAGEQHESAVKTTGIIIANRGGARPGSRGIDRFNGHPSAENPASLRGAHQFASVNLAAAGKTGGYG